MSETPDRLNTPLLLLLPVYDLKFNAGRPRMFAVGVYENETGGYVKVEDLRAALTGVPPLDSQPWCSCCGHSVYLHDGQKCAVEGGCKYGCVALADAPPDQWLLVADEPSVLGAGSGPAPMPTQADREAAQFAQFEEDHLGVTRDITVVPVPGEWTEELLNKLKGHACTAYTRPAGVLGGPCLTCGRSQPEHIEER